MPLPKCLKWMAFLGFVWWQSTQYKKEKNSYIIMVIDEQMFWNQILGYAHKCTLTTWWQTLVNAHTCIYTNNVTLYWQIFLCFYSKEIILSVEWSLQQSYTTGMLWFASLLHWPAQLSDCLWPRIVDSCPFCNQYCILCVHRPYYINMHSSET